MRFDLMALRLPRRLKLGRLPSFGRRGNIALAGLGALLITSLPSSPSQAQVIIGGHGGPAVSVDNSVLERLGPPLTLPQYFLGERDPGALNRRVATNQRSPHSAAPSHRTANRHVATRHVTHRKTAIVKARPSRAAKAPVKMASSLNQIIHLIPPKSRIAGATPSTSTPPRQQSTTQQAANTPTITHQEAAISAPTKPAVAALAAPATPTPAPKQPASRDTPTPALVPPQQAREETPPAPVTPPSQPVVAAAAPAAAAPATPVAIASTKPVATPAMTVTPNAGAAPYVPFSTVAAIAPSGPTITVAAAVPTPMTVTPNVSAPAAAGSPVQMASATTVGNAASALKFKAGATDIGSSAQPVLDNIANRLLANESLRVQIVSHATGGADDAMEARRVSLARAVAVRAYLIEKGVRSLRIDVRALGNRADTGPAADQVDLLIVSQ
jgi:outer membrane protein OmpA-like peptidoglycan-associated protein